MERLIRLEEFGKEIQPFGPEWLPTPAHHAVAHHIVFQVSGG